MSAYGGGTAKITVRCKGCGNLLAWDGNAWYHINYEAHDHCRNMQPIAGEAR